jgi:hypothetical protein
MVEFRKFMTGYFALVIITSLLITGGLVLLQNSGKSTNFIYKPANTLGHFSVKYRGFLPGYDSSYPDYYIAINGLAVSSLQMNVHLFIQNQESSGYYFKIEKNETPPAGWIINPYQIGQIPVDGTRDFVYSQMWRTVPTSIPAGELIETVYLAVRAYYDASYTNLYSQDVLNITYHLIDRASPVWTTLYQDTFDDGTTQGWSGGQNIAVSTDYYRSFRYSLAVSYYNYPGLQNSFFAKTFSVPPQYSEGYLIFAIRRDGWQADFPQIYLDGTLYFEPDTTPSSNIWYQFTIPLHAGSTNIRIETCHLSGVPTYMDDAYVVAK